MREGDEVEVSIHQLHASGAGVVQSTSGRKPLRVVGAFPEERVRVRLTHVGKHEAHGALLEVLDPDPARRRTPCDQHESQPSGRCTGCALMPLTPKRQREVKREWLDEAYGLVVDELRFGAAKGYRWSSKRVAFGGPGNVRLGSFTRGSHRVAVMYGCEVEHPVIAQAMMLVERAARSTEVTGYDEQKARGDLRYVWAKTDGHRALVTLIGAHDRREVWSGLKASIERDRDAPLLAGLALSVHQGGNAVRGSEPRMLFGAPALDVDLGGITTPVGPLGFLQPNPALAAECYRDLTDGIGGGIGGGGGGGKTLLPLALDLYAGAGITTRMMRAAGAEVVPVESYEESARALGVAPQKTEAFLQGYTGPTPRWVVANPPRKGLGREVTDALRRLAPEEIRVMSCGPAGLAQDLRALSGQEDQNPQGEDAAAVSADAPARYEMTQLRAYDTLPQTPHVELVAHLRRV